LKGVEAVVKSMLYALVGVMVVMVVMSFYFMYCAYRAFQIGTDIGNFVGGALLVLSGAILLGSIGIQQFVFPLLEIKTDGGEKE